MVGRQGRHETQNWKILKNKRESLMKSVREQLKVGLWSHPVRMKSARFSKVSLNLFRASFALADAAMHHGGVHVMPNYNTVWQKTPPNSYAFCGSHLWDGTTQTPLQPGSSMLFGGWCFRGLRWSMSCSSWLCPCWGFYCFTLSFPYNLLDVLFLPCKVSKLCPKSPKS